MAIEIELEPAARQNASRSASSILHTKISLFEKKLGAQERILFTEGLALQLETGVNLHAALVSMRAQIEKEKMREIITAIIENIESGGKFSQALSKHPELFPSTYVNLIAVAENGGFLGQVLDQLRDMDEKQERLHATVVSALSYPAFLMLFSIAVVVYVLVGVFPKFSVMFANMYAELPVTTKFLMGASDFLLKHPFIIMVTFVAMAVGMLALLRRPAGKLWLDRVKLKAPGLRDIYIQIYLTRLMRTMGISLQNGVTVLATLTACREVVSNIQFQGFIAKLEADVTEGKGIAAGFTGTDYIPSSVTQMINTGEETGKLGHVMTRIADYYDRELTKRLQQTAKMAEPVMLLVMGGVVGVIVSSLILPIFKMSRAMH